MGVEIEPVRTVRQNLGKEINRIAQEEVKSMMEKGVPKTKSDNMDFDDDEFIDETDGVNHSGLNSADFESPTNLISDEEKDKILAEIEAKESFDIFSAVGDYWEKESQIIRYTLNKGGKFLTKKDHPYSWEEIQKDFGAGNYKVLAHLPANGNKYLKCQSKSLLSSPESNPEFVFKNLFEKNKALTDEKTQQSNQGFNMQEVLETVRQTNQANIDQANELRRESLLQAEKIRQEAKSEARSTIEMITTMMDKNRPEKGPDLLAQLAPLLTAILPKLLERPAPAVAVDNSKQTFDMMMKLQQMNVDMMKDNQESNKEMFKALSESIKEIAKEKKSNTNEPVDPMVMYKMLKDAERDGFEQMKMLNDLATERAEEREELRGNREAPTEKESTIDTVIKGMIPLLANRLGGPTPQAVQPQPVQRIASPQASPTSQPRGAVSPNTNGPRPHESGVNRATVQTHQARTDERNGIQSQTGDRTIQKPNVVDVSKIPVYDFLNSGDEPVFIHSEGKVSLMENTSPVENNSQKDQANAEAILSIVAPIAIGSYAEEGVTVDQIANQAITELTAHHIDLATVKRDFDEETLTGIISSLPEDLQLLTRDLRNAILFKIEHGISN